MKSIFKEVFFVSAVPGIIGGIMNLILYQITHSGIIHVIPFPLCVVAAFYFFAQQKISTPLNFIKSFCIGFISSVFFCLFIVANAFYYNHFRGIKHTPISVDDVWLVIISIAASAVIGLLIAFFILGMQILVIRQSSKFSPELKK